MKKYLFIFLMILLVQPVRGNIVIENRTVFFAMNETSGTISYDEVFNSTINTVGSTDIRNGYSGKGRASDGASTTYTLTPNNGSFNLTSGDWTIMFDLNRTSVNINAVSFFASNTPTYSCLVVGTGGDANFTAYASTDGSSWNVFQMGMGAPNLNTWATFTIKRNGTTYSTYLNGNRTSFTDTATNVCAFPDIRLMGIAPQYMIGTMDNLVVYKRALPDSEIVDYYYNHSFTTSFINIVSPRNGTVFNNTQSTLFNASCWNGNPSNPFNITDNGVTIYSNSSLLNNTYATFVQNYPVYGEHNITFVCANQIYPVYYYLNDTVAPIISYVNITPSNPYRSTALNCSVFATVSFPENTTIFANFTWFKNGVFDSNFINISSALNGTLISTQKLVNSSFLTRYDNWTCSVNTYKIVNGRYSGWFNSTKVTINHTNSSYNIYSNGVKVYNYSMPNEQTSARFSLDASIINQFLSNCTTDSNGDCYFPITIESSKYSYLTLMNLSLENRDFPTNITIEIGGDRSNSINYELNQTNSPLQVYLDHSLFMNNLSGCSQDSQGFCEVAMSVNSSTGNITFSNPLITYNTTGARDTSIWVGDFPVFTNSGILNTTNETSIDLIASVINAYLSLCNTSICTVPINFKSEPGSQYRYRNLSVDYVFTNPIELDESIINNYVRDCATDPCVLPINLTSERTNSYVNISWNFVYWLSDVTLTTGPVNAFLNVSIKAKKSLIDVTFPNSWGFFDVYPKTNNDKNLQPEGQTSTLPIFNISYLTNNTDAYIWINNTLSNCIKIEFRNQSNSTGATAFVVNTTPQKIQSNYSLGQYSSAFAYVNLSVCPASTVFSPIFYIEPICTECVVESWLQ